MQTRTDYIEGTTDQLDLWSNKLAHIEEKVAAESPQQRARLQGQLKQLKRKQRELELRLRHAAHGGPRPEWDDLRGELEEAVSDFRHQALEVYDHAGVRRA